MSLYLVKYLVISQKTKLPSGTSGAIISASSVSKAKYIFKCSHVDNAKIKYKVTSVVKK